MSHAIEVKLTVHYYGLKATQYFSKASPESENVFLDDMLALKLPLPKRGNTALISFGRMQCTWPSVQKNGLLHKQIKMRVEPFSDFRSAAQELHAELSMYCANVMAKFRDLDSSEITQVSFKRPFKDVEDTSSEERPWKKKKIEQDPRGMNAAYPISPPKRAPNPPKHKPASNSASEKPPLAPKAMTMSDRQWKTLRKPSQSTGSPSTSSQHDSAPPRRLSTSDANDAASEFLNSMEMPKGLPNRDYTSRWDTAVKRPTHDQAKPPPFSAPAAIQSLSRTFSSQPSTTSSNAPVAPPLPPPHRSSTSSTSALPARPSPNPPSLSAPAGNDAVRKPSRFAPAPAPPPQYSLHTLAAFAKEYTGKIERLSPDVFEKQLAPAPAPAPAPHLPATQPPRLAAADWAPRSAAGGPLAGPSSAASTPSSMTMTSAAVASGSGLASEPIQLAARKDHDVADGAARVHFGGMRSKWPEDGPALSKAAATNALVPQGGVVGPVVASERKLRAATISGEREKTGVVREDVEMRDAQRRAPPLATPPTPSGATHYDRKRNIESGASGIATTPKGHGTDLTPPASAASAALVAELRGRLAKAEADLAQERRRRQAAEHAIADIRRECRAPFVVPSLLDAFVELSRLATVATTTTTTPQNHHPGSLVVSLPPPPPPQLGGGSMANKLQPSQNHTDSSNKSGAANGSSARRASNVGVTAVTAANRALPSPSVTYSNSSGHQQQNTTRMNGGGPTMPQWPGGSLRPSPVFVRGGAGNVQHSSPVRVKEEPVEIRMNWR